MQFFIIELRYKLFEFIYSLNKNKLVVQFVKVREFWKWNIVQSHVRKIVKRAWKCIGNQILDVYNICIYFAKQKGLHRVSLFIKFPTVWQSCVIFLGLHLVGTIFNFIVPLLARCYFIIYIIIKRPILVNFIHFFFPLLVTIPLQKI